MSQPLAPRRAVILGASNVYRNISLAIETARQAWGQPLELLIAAGHGRSYGLWNRVLGYSVPGITECGLWRAFSARNGVPTSALVTDIGNDLLYGASAQEILAWVETCLARLAPHCERLTISRLPLERALQLRSWQFVALRTFMFPGCRLSLRDVLDGVERINDGVTQLAKRYGAALVHPELSWYGIDPIHFRRTRAQAAWHALLGPWTTSPGSLTARGSVRHWWRVRRCRTAVQRFCGIETITAQPSLVSAEGDSISLY